MKNIKKQKIQVKYFSDEIEPIKEISCGDWIDLRAAKDMEIKKDTFALIPLGVGMILPRGYEALLLPRSSTFKKFHIIQANGMGVIDESYCGDNDQWCMPVYAVEDTVIHLNDRICQFRIIEHQPSLSFEQVDKLCDTDRNGFGSTGVQ